MMPPKMNYKFAGDGHDAVAATVAAVETDPWTLGALEFLERSRDVANEVVVDGTRGETSTSRREENVSPRSRSAV